MNRSRKTIRFLWGSLAVLIILCVVVFSWVTISVIRQGASTMTQVETTYMEGMSQQTQNHFDTLVEMRIAQVKAITQAVAPETVTELDESLVKRLAAVAALREFTHLFLYDTEGNDVPIYGTPVEVEMCLRDRPSAGEKYRPDRRHRHGSGPVSSTHLMI